MDSVASHSDSGRALDHIVLTVRDLDRAAATYEALGFTLTPRASHNDQMGTSNRIAQFAGRNFIEILEVDRPDGQTPHDFTASPPVFSFGAHNRAFVEDGEGMAMLVFQGVDAAEEVAGFARRGIDTYAPFGFTRQAKLPSGESVTVGFSLAFATSPHMQRTAFFTCQNLKPELFWKPDYQAHGNGATGIRAIYLASPDPARDAGFAAQMFGGAMSEAEGIFTIACGAEGEIRVASVETITGIDPSWRDPCTHGARLAGIALASAEARPPVPQESAHGMFLRFEPA